jgi:hypothetical protein
VLIGGPGADTTDGGTGDNVVIASLINATVSDAVVAGRNVLASHASTAQGTTVLHVNGKKQRGPRATLARPARSL